jgi:hypothetical protein
MIKHWFDPKALSQIHTTMNFHHASYDSNRYRAHNCSLLSKQIRNKTNNKEYMYVNPFFCQEKLALMTKVIYKHLTGIFSLII